jgi:uncharacterized protein (DUF885 family)
MRRITLALLLAPLGFLTVDTAFAAKAANAPLVKLFDTTWEEDLADDPVWATQIGDARYNDRWPDMSVEALDRRQKKNYARLQSLLKINRDKLGKDDQLNFDLFQREIKTRIEAYQFKPWVFAPRTFEGPQLLAQTAEFAPFNTVKDYDNWIARINTTGIYLDQWILLLTQGANEKLTQPRVTINKVLDQLKGRSPPIQRPIRSTRPSRRCRPAFRPPSRRGSPPPARRPCRWWRSRLPASRQVLPRVYLPASRDTVGIYDTPGGEQYYRNRIRYFTTVDNLDAARIHNLGLEEVKRIRAKWKRRSRASTSSARSNSSWIHPHRSALLLQDAAGTDGRV